MKINIYGVGRSGTKAVQLYLSYLLAVRHGQARINYEPYYWLGRKGGINFQGWKYNTADPQLIMDVKDISPGHRKFLTRMKDEGDMPVVTKFIRGLGRIDAIEELMAPDLSVVVVRDLYSVLSSLLQMSWDYYQIYDLPLGRRSVWEQLLQDAREYGFIDYGILNEISKINPDEDRISQSAFYWYAMNKWALSSEKEHHFIKYEKIEEMNSLAINLGIANADSPGISDPFFRGGTLHGDYPLKTENSWEAKRKYLNIANELSYYAFNRVAKRFPVPFPFRPGDIVTVNEAAGTQDAMKVKSKFKYRCKVQPTELLEFFNNDIAEHLAARRKQQVAANEG